MKSPQQLDDNVIIIEDDVVVIDDDVIINENYVIIIDDDDELSDTVAKTVNREITKQKRSVEHLTKDSIDSPNISKRLALPLIDLNKLFFCRECGKSIMHLNINKQ